MTQKASTKAAMQGADLCKALLPLIVRHAKESGDADAFYSGLFASFGGILSQQLGHDRAVGMIEDMKTVVREHQKRFNNG